jgi:hypothetical protein
MITAVHSKVIINDPTAIFFLLIFVTGEVLCWGETRSVSAVVAQFFSSDFC